MNILVVGGAGYIGSHVVRAFLDKKYSVTVFDNLSSGCRENLFKEAVFVEGDIRSEREINQAMGKGFDGFIHLAAYKAAGESMIVPEKYSVNNISGTINLLNAAAAHRMVRCVFSSSAAVYGEPKYLPIDEKHPCNPENYYGFTKLEIERLLEWYDRLKNIHFAALRYFNAAGYDPAGRITGLERNPANLLPVVMEVAVGIRQKLEIFGNDYGTPDGTCIRDYIHVSDLADAHVLAFENLVKSNKSFIVNLGSENGISVKTMVEKAREITGKPIPAVIGSRRKGDPAKLVASSKEACKLLGWKTRVSDVTTLLSSTWNVYKNIKQ
ncbi:MAG: UDP-glucose 4-epimerase GalE [Chitinispirillaceae bacterium]